MTTKKQIKSGKIVDWGRLTFEHLIKANQSKDYTGKTELDKCKDLKALPSENIFKYIVISYGKLKLIFPLTEEEYNNYKKLEAEYWGKK
jgi:hypothetical protein